MVRLSKTSLVGCLVFLGTALDIERAVFSSSKPTAACFGGFVCSLLSNGSRIWFLLNQEAETLLQLHYQGSSKKFVSLKDLEKVMTFCKTWLTICHNSFQIFGQL